MTSAKLALARGKWNTAGEVIFDGIKNINATPTSKRNPSVFLADSLLTTRPYAQGELLETTPYDKRFAQREDEDGTGGWELTDDGSVRLDMNAMLHGK
jgi:hypothetical protein